MVGSGWHFTSGISHYTYRLSSALADRVSRRHLAHASPCASAPISRPRPRRAPQVANVVYPPDMPVYDGVDWYWGPSLTHALRYLDRQRPTVLVLQWWTGAVLHTYLRLARHAVRLGARVIMEWHEGQDVGEAALPGTRHYVRTLMPRLLSRVDAHVVHSDFDLRAITNLVLAGRRARSRDRRTAPTTTSSTPRRPRLLPIAGRPRSGSCTSASSARLKVSKTWWPRSVRSTVIRPAGSACPWSVRPGNAGQSRTRPSPEVRTRA